jgi:hypothetical protein
MRPIIYIRWNAQLPNKAKNPLRTKEWTDIRLPVGERFVMPAILRQTYEDWKCYLVCHEGIEGTPRMIATLKDSRFGVLMDHELRSPWAAGTHVEQGLNLMIRIDSDDIMAPTLLERMRQISLASEKELVQPKNGWLYDIPSDRLYRYVHPSVAIVGRKYNGANGPLSPGIGISHARVGRKSERFKDKLYCLTSHGANFVTTPRNSACRKVSLEPDKERSIREEFGLPAMKEKV